MKITCIPNVEKVYQIQNNLKKKNCACPCEELITTGVKRKECIECIYIY